MEHLATFGAHATSPPIAAIYSIVLQIHRQLKLNLLDMEVWERLWVDRHKVINGPMALLRNSLDKWPIDWVAPYVLKTDTLQFDFSDDAVIAGKGKHNLTENCCALQWPADLPMSVPRTSVACSMALTGNLLESSLPKNVALPWSLVVNGPRCLFTYPTLPWCLLSAHVAFYVKKQGSIVSGHVLAALLSGIDCTMTLR